MTNGPAPSAPHGTISAYKRHLRHKETPCAACRAVWAEYHRNRYQLQRSANVDIRPMSANHD